MSAVSGAVEWSGKHPVVLAVGVFALGAVILLMLKGGGGSAAAGGMGQFYAAQAAQAASGNSLMAVQANDKTAVALAQLASTRDTTLGLANLSTQQTLGLAANDTAQQGQRQQFWLATGIQQIFGNQLPFLTADLSAGGQPGADALAAELAFINGGVHYVAH